MDLAWRLHLSNRTIQYLDILNGKRSLLGAWIRRDRVAFYDLETGAVAGEKSLEIPHETDRTSLEWQNFINELKAPNEASLRIVRMPNATLRTTEDKKVCLFRSGPAGLYVVIDGTEHTLDVGEVKMFIDIDLDPKAGVIGALDETARLHLYRHNTRLGDYDLNLTFDPDLRPLIAIGTHGQSIYVTDRRQIIRTDTTGQIRKKRQLVHAVSRMACSMNGKWVVTSDLDTGVIRVYDGENFQQTHQRFAVDLLADARQLQLIADLPTAAVAVSALSIKDDGVLTFAISGMICVTHIDRMNKLPGLERSLT